MNTNDLLRQAKSALETVWAARDASAAPASDRPACTLFFSLGSAEARAHVLRATGADLAQAWREGERLASEWAEAQEQAPIWLRVDAVDVVEGMRWDALQAIFAAVKRNYFRFGIALEADLSIAMLEPEIGANALLYDNAVESATPNAGNLAGYGKRRFGQALEWPTQPAQPIWIFSTRAVFTDGAQAHVIEQQGPNHGYRQLPRWDAEAVREIVHTSTAYLAAQVRPSGEYHYGWFPCFDRPIPTYNALRHASSTYALLEGWELTQDAVHRAAQMDAIESALAYLRGTLIRHVDLPDGQRAAFLVDLGDEIKLGGNAVCLLAFVKYTELTGDEQYLPLLAELALGIVHMQDPATGRFVHVLLHPDLRLKAEHRTIYYDGEAAFGLMRLYGLTRDPRWLQTVEKAVAYFIEAEHWRAHDHWLSYCIDELTLYRPEARYFRFGLDNVRGYLDFVLERITTYPTLLELMMAAQKMVTRLQADPALVSLLDGFDLAKFERALAYRARYLLNGHFWPELAMFFRNPGRIVGSFFIRHHSFRVRIDDVEHYLSGYVAYLGHLERAAPAAPALVSPPLAKAAAVPGTRRPVVLWGGDVNIGRRQHYRAAELGMQQVLAPVRAIARADLSIVNLECVVATGGRLGVPKGEGGPYHFRARPEMLEVLCAAGVDVVTTANNHSGDYGPEALREQLQWLEAVGLAQAGSGTDLASAWTPAIRSAGPFSVAIFSVDATQPRFAAGADTPGSAYLSLDDAAAWQTVLAPRIAHARRQAHVVLVAVHWGANHALRPSGAQTAVGRAIIDAGADVVLGASAHVLQGVEVYRDRPILYDAGDLLFDARRTDGGEGGVFELELGADGVERVVFVPLRVGFGQSIQCEDAEAAAATARYAARCAELGVTLLPQPDGSGAVELRPPPRVPPEVRVARRTRYDLSAVQRARPEPSGTEVDAVPPEALLAEPIRFGPITLLGLQVDAPQPIVERRSIQVTSFWTCDAPMAQDYRLDIRAQPVPASTMPPWGLSMDHDPCDWRVPTSRWQPGMIYRDDAPLRPPGLSEWVPGRMQLEIALIVSRDRLHRQVLPVFFDLVGKAKAAGPSASPAASVTAPPSYRTDFDAACLGATPGQTWNAEQLRAITGGEWIVPPPADWSVRSVVSSGKYLSMRATPALYVAHDSFDRWRHERSTAPTNNVDRHLLLPALVPGLVGAIVSRPVPGLPADFPLLQVTDPIRALIEIGLAARARYTGEVVAITGTVGKSTTLSMLSLALGGPGRVLASVDNYNSRVGAPSMLASLSTSHEAAVLEVAQSALWMKQGPITRQLRPTVALITGIGFSQTQAMVKSIEDVVRWKSRIFDGLSGQATAVVGDHLPHFSEVLSRARRHAKRCIVYGTGAQADIRLLRVDADALGSKVEVDVAGQRLSFRVPLPGLGMVHNALGVAAVLHALGRDVAEGVARLEGLEAEEGRLQRHTLSWGGIDVEVLDDSWNAEVESMRHAFSVLALDRPERRGRKVAVLGRIVHLGDMARTLHESLAQPLLAAGPDLVLTHGEEMKYLRAVLPPSVLGPHFESADTMAQHLRQTLRHGDTVLLKGSRRNSDFGQTMARLRALCADAGNLEASA